VIALMGRRPNADGQSGLAGSKIERDSVPANSDYALRLSRYRQQRKEN